MRGFSSHRPVIRVTHFPCKYCKEEIVFDELDIGSNSKLIPLNYPKKSRHQCKSPTNPYNKVRGAVA